ncbi:MAG: hypothetical protein M0P31_12515 [Solirubrobacteraceae bacterium]|nr:hypothetical protein [Solirubrobacteraceae bacterium]
MDAVVRWWRRLEPTPRAIVLLVLALLVLLVVGRPFSGTSTPEDPLAVALARPGAGGGTMDVDLWATTDRLVRPIDGRWSAGRRSYLDAEGRVARRVDLEMLLVHAQAAEAGHRGVARRDRRIAPLVVRILDDHYVPERDGRKVQPFNPSSDYTSFPGFSTTIRTVTMHPSFTAVVMQALAAAWRVRDRVGLPAATSRRIREAVVGVAGADGWSGDERALNQVNWNVDVYEAHADVTDDPRMLRDDYRRQLVWLLQHARAPVSADGSPNLTSGLGFRYHPFFRADHVVNRAHTAEYANLVIGALGAYDRAVEAGMEPLPPELLDVARRWIRRTAMGDWTPSGVLNWDTGLGRDRLYLTQYWVHALRGALSALRGTRRAGLIEGQEELARGLVRAAAWVLQDRERQEGTSAISPAFYGMTGSVFTETGGNPQVSGSRLASTLAGVALDGLDEGRYLPLPEAYSHDAELGRMTVATARMATAVVRPYGPLRWGGIEPARLFDDRGRAVTHVGGSGDGSLGLRIDDGDVRILETQPGQTTMSQSLIRPAPDDVDVARPLVGAMQATADDRGPGVEVSLQHRFDAGTITTVYVLRNTAGRPLRATLRIPTYGRGRPARLRDRAMTTALRVRGEDLKQMPIETASGTRFVAGLFGLPADAEGVVERPRAQLSNPEPGPQLTVRFALPPGELRVTRVIGVPPSSEGGDGDSSGAAD